jgi:hypothetical protein
MFPGRDRVQPMTTRQLNHACHAAAQMVEINKRVSLHTLRAQLCDTSARAEHRCPGDAQVATNLLQTVTRSSLHSPLLFSTVLSRPITRRQLAHLREE